MRAFVTGAGGFVGRHLVAHLEAAGDEVAGLPEGVDVADEAAVAGAVRAVAPEVVYHLAGWAHVGASWDRPAEVARVNVAGTAAVVAAAAAAGARRVLVVGSSDAYGSPAPEDLPMVEELPLRPVTPYGASKAAAEVVAMQAWRAGRVEVVATRSFNHTGPGQAPTFVVPAIARRIAEARARGDAAIPVGNLDARRDLLDVRDVVDAYRRLAVDGEPGEAYNVCSGEAVRVGDLVERLLELAGGDLRLEVDPQLVRPVDVPEVRGSFAKLAGRTGWSPARPLAQAVADVLADQAAAVAAG